MFSSYSFEASLGNKKIQAKWENAFEESGKPYDILVKLDDGKEKCDFYIEVKTTSCSCNAPFFLTPRELEMARILGNQYIIFRVIGAGSQNPRCIKLQNLVKLWLEGKYSFQFKSNLTVKEN